MIMLNGRIIVIFMLLIFSSCEKVEVTYPGNNQENESVAPDGAIIWDENNVEINDGKATLPENTAPGVTIGRLNATDNNPDDEFTYEKESEAIDGIDVNYFTIQKDDDNFDLVTNGNTINYENLSGSREVKVTITVTDDNIDPKTSNFDVIVGISNVNEAPYWANSNGVEIVNYQPSINGDIEIPLTGILYWDDADDDQNPDLIVSEQKPSWLSINTTGTTASLSGTPNSVETGSFLLTITDGEFEVPVDMSYEVRPNQRPYLQSFSPNYSFRVGCKQIADEILSYNVIDPNNNYLNYTSEYDILTVAENEEVGWLAIDINNNNTKTPNLVLRCVSTPSNDDASLGAQEIIFNINDNRNSVPEDTTYQLVITVLENHEPEFINIEAFPDTIYVGSETTWTVEWDDLDDDQIDMYIQNKPNFIEYDAATGLVTANPSIIHDGITYEMQYMLNEGNDGCFSISYNHIFYIPQ